MSADSHSILQSLQAAQPKFNTLEQYQDAIAKANADLEKVTKESGDCDKKIEAEKASVNSKIQLAFGKKTKELIHLEGKRAELAQQQSEVQALVISLTNEAAEQEEAQKNQRVEALRKLHGLFIDQQRQEKEGLIYAAYGFETLQDEAEFNKTEKKPNIIYVAPVSKSVSGQNTGQYICKILSDVSFYIEAGVDSYDIVNARVVTQQFQEEFELLQRQPKPNDAEEYAASIFRIKSYCNKISSKLEKTKYWELSGVGPLVWLRKKSVKELHQELKRLREEAQQLSNKLTQEKTISQLKADFKQLEAGVSNTQNFESTNACIQRFESYIAKIEKADAKVKAELSDMQKEAKVLLLAMREMQALRVLKQILEQMKEPSAQVAYSIRELDNSEVDNAEGRPDTILIGKEENHDKGEYPCKIFDKEGKVPPLLFYVGKKLYEDIQKIIKVEREVVDEIRDLAAGLTNLRKFELDNPEEYQTTSQNVSKYYEEIGLKALRYEEALSKVYPTLWQKYKKEFSDLQAETQQFLSKLTLRCIQEEEKKKAAIKKFGDQLDHIQDTEMKRRVEEFSFEYLPDATSVKESGKQGGTSRYTVYIEPAKNTEVTPSAEKYCCKYFDADGHGTVFYVGDEIYKKIQDIEGARAARKAEANLVATYKSKFTKLKEEVKSNRKTAVKSVENYRDELKTKIEEIPKPDSGRTNTQKDIDKRNRDGLTQLQGWAERLLEALKHEIAQEEQIQKFKEEFCQVKDELNLVKNIDSIGAYIQKLEQYIGKISDKTELSNEQEEVKKLLAQMSIIKNLIIKFEEDLVQISEQEIMNEQGLLQYEEIFLGSIVQFNEDVLIKSKVYDIVMEYTFEQVDAKRKAQQVIEQFKEAERLKLLLQFQAELALIINPKEGDVWSQLRNLAKQAVVGDEVPRKEIQVQEDKQLERFLKRIGAKISEVEATGSDAVLAAGLNKIKQGAQQKLDELRAQAQENIRILLQPLQVELDAISGNEDEIDEKFDGLLENIDKAIESNQNEEFRRKLLNFRKDAQEKLDSLCELARLERFKNQEVLLQEELNCNRLQDLELKIEQYSAEIEATEDDPRFASIRDKLKPYKELVQRLLKEAEQKSILNEIKDQYEQLEKFQPTEEDREQPDQKLEVFVREIERISTTVALDVIFAAELNKIKQDAQQQLDDLRAQEQERLSTLLQKFQIQLNAISGSEDEIEKKIDDLLKGIGKAIESNPNEESVKKLHEFRNDAQEKVDSLRELARLEKFKKAAVLLQEDLEANKLQGLEVKIEQYRTEIETTEDDPKFASIRDKLKSYKELAQRLSKEAEQKSMLNKIKDQYEQLKARFQLTEESGEQLDKKLEAFLREIKLISTTIELDIVSAVELNKIKQDVQQQLDELYTQVQESIRILLQPLQIELDAIAGSEDEIEKKFDDLLERIKKAIELNPHEEFRRNLLRFKQDAQEKIDSLCELARLERFKNQEVLLQEELNCNRLQDLELKIEQYSAEIEATEDDPRFASIDEEFREKLRGFRQKVRDRIEEGEKQQHVLAKAYEQQKKCVDELKVSDDTLQKEDETLSKYKKFEDDMENVISKKAPLSEEKAQKIIALGRLLEEVNAKNCQLKAVNEKIRREKATRYKMQTEIEAAIETLISKHERFAVKPASLWTRISRSSRSEQLAESLNLIKNDMKNSSVKMSEIRGRLVAAIEAFKSNGSKNDDLIEFEKELKNTIPECSLDGIDSLQQERVKMSSAQNTTMDKDIPKLNEEITDRHNKLEAFNTTISALENKIQMLQPQVKAINNRRKAEVTEKSNLQQVEELRAKSQRGQLIDAPNIEWLKTLSEKVAPLHIVHDASSTSGIVEEVEIFREVPFLIQDEIINTPFEQRKDKKTVSEDVVLKAKLVKIADPEIDPNTGKTPHYDRDANRNMGEIRKKHLMGVLEDSASKRLQQKSAAPLSPISSARIALAKQEELTRQEELQATLDVLTERAKISGLSNEHIQGVNREHQITQQLQQQSESDNVNTDGKSSLTGAVCAFFKLSAVGMNIGENPQQLQPAPLTVDSSEQPQLNAPEIM